MPAAPFSYERDIAPHASRYFDDVESDPMLSRQMKSQLQGTMLNGIDDIRKQRAQIQEEQQTRKMRELSYLSGMENLQASRAERARVEQQAGQSVSAQQAVKDIVRSSAPSMDKSQALADFAMDNASLIAQNRDVGEVVNIGFKSLKEPKEDFTNSQKLDMAVHNVPKDVIGRGDPEEIAHHIRQNAAAEDELEARTKFIASKTKEAEEYRDKLIGKDLEFDKDDEGNEGVWLKPESTLHAEVLVRALGSPEEQKRFAALKSAPSDRDRAAIVNNIRLREALGKLGQFTSQQAEGKTPKINVSEKLGF